jgi:hypothetical protein
VAADLAHATTAGTTTLVHVRSCRTRAEAEAFAAALVVEPGKRIWLQTAAQGATTWVRVLVGDFASTAEAEAYARDATTGGRLDYARAVQIAPAGLEVWASRHASGAQPGAPTGGRSD